MKISVIIPAFNEEKVISCCLEALSQQTCTEPFEVIVVNNASTDRTTEVAQSFSGTLNVRVIDEPRKGRGAARAAGFQIATGDVLLSTDADSVVPSAWIDTFLRFFREHPECVAATSPPFIDDCTPMRNWIFNFFVPILTHWFNVLFFGHPGMYGFSFAVKRDAYVRSGGFSPDDDAYEDLVLAHKVSRIGRIGWIPTPSVLFSGRRFHQGLLKGWWDYIRSFARKFVFKKSVVLLSDKR